LPSWDVVPVGNQILSMRDQLLKIGVDPQTIATERTLGIGEWHPEFVSDVDQPRFDIGRRELVVVRVEGTTRT
jgi:hypothetical protein